MCQAPFSPSGVCRRCELGVYLGPPAVHRGCCRCPLVSSQPAGCCPRESLRAPAPWAPPKGQDCRASPAWAAVFGTRRSFGLLWGGAGRGRAGLLQVPARNQIFGYWDSIEGGRDSSCTASSLQLGSG